MKKILHILLFGFITFTGFAQINYQQEYLKGKSFFNEGKYNLAMETFKPLTKEAAGNSFTEYASFYYAVAAFKMDYPALARDMFLQIKQLHPKWDKLDEVYLWLARVSFEENNWLKGIEYSNAISAINPKGVNQKVYYLNRTDSIALLDTLFQEFDSDKQVAYRYAQLISEQPIYNQDRELLKTIVNDFVFDEDEFLLVTKAESVKKDTYNIAVMLPFIMDKLQPNLYKKGNQFVLDIYDGVKKAQLDLASEDIHVNIHAYDTKKSASETRHLLQRPEMLGMDMFIGPLYPEPSLEVNNFSLENKINMFNPLSSNQDVIGENPFSFLYHPSDITQAKAAAHYTFENDTIKNVMIFYGGSDRDSLRAYTYKELVEADSFNVVHIQKIEKDTSRHVLQLLTATMEDVQKNVEEPIVIIDSLTGEEIELKDIFLIKPDSIGTIYVASDNKLLASSVVSAIEIRPDTIQVIGSTEWLKYKFIDFEAYERLGIVLTSNNYFDTHKHKSRMLSHYCIAKYGKPASIYFLKAYDMTMFIGRNLEKYGNLFQNSVYDIKEMSSDLLDGISYYQANDNQYVPVVQFKDNSITKVSLAKLDEQANK